MNDPDADFLLDGIRNGFHLVSNFDFKPAEVDNYSSVENPKFRELV